MVTTSSHVLRSNNRSKNICTIQIPNLPLITRGF